MTDEPMQDATVDPFDLDALRVEGLDDIGVEKVLLTVPVRKPRKTEFFRVHPDEDYCLDSMVLVCAPSWPTMPSVFGCSPA
jgi:hypothetical protein